MVLRLLGGGNGEKKAEMALAKGGKIKQAVNRDTYPDSIWRKDTTIAFNVQLLNSLAFTAVTGNLVPPTPVDMTTYTNHGYPFFEMWEEPSAVSGDFQSAKTVTELDGKPDAHVEPLRIVHLDSTGKHLPHGADPNKATTVVNDPDGLLDPSGPLRPVRTKYDLVCDLTKTRVPQC